MEYEIQEGAEVERTLDNAYLDTPEDHKEFFDRFKTWDQIRTERYNC